MYDAEQMAVKQFLGTRPPQVKSALQSSRLYSNFPILGGQDAMPVPSGDPANARLSPVQQPGPIPHTNVSTIPGCHPTNIFGSVLLQCLHGTMTYPT